MVDSFTNLFRRNDDSLLNVSDGWRWTLSVCGRAYIGPHCGFTYFLASDRHLLCFISVVSLYVFHCDVSQMRELADHAYTHAFVIWDCIRTKGGVRASLSPAPFPPPEVPRRFFCCSSFLFVRQWFHMWCLFCSYLFHISHSFGASHFLIVAFPEHLHLSEADSEEVRLTPPPPPHQLKISFSRITFGYLIHSIYSHPLLFTL